MIVENGVVVMHWIPEEDRWEIIPWQVWAHFRGIVSRSVGLPNITGGVHHFAVVIFDGDDPVNIITHKYLIEPDGSLGSDNFGGLTREERDDERRLMLAHKLTTDDQIRLAEIREKLDKVYEPSRESIAALKWALPRGPAVGSAADIFLSKYK